MTMNLREAARLSGRVIYLEIITLVLSLFSLLSLAAEVSLPLAPEQHELLRDIDTWICLVFFADFVVHLYKAPSKLAYLKWGWIDLLSSIPVVEWRGPGSLDQVIRDVSRRAAAPRMVVR